MSNEMGLLSVILALGVGLMVLGSYVFEDGITIATVRMTNPLCCLPARAVVTATTPWMPMQCWYVAADTCPEGME